jgi:CheY-like chemotaxis protein
LQKCKMAQDLILIVEDDKDWRDHLATILEENGYCCKTASAFPSAIEKLRSLAPVTLILDMRLGREEVNEGDWGGWELAREAQEQGVSTVVVTGAAKEPHITDRLHREFGVVGLFDKAYLVEHKSLFIQRVAQAVENTRRRRIELEEKKSPKGDKQREIVQIQFEHIMPAYNEPQFFLRIMCSSQGEPIEKFSPPFQGDSLKYLLKIIREEQKSFSKWSTEEINALKLQGIGADQIAEKDFLEQVGIKLYDSLAIKMVGIALTMMIQNAFLPTTSLATLQLRMDEDSIELAQFPWELIHDRYRYWAHEAISLVRYVSCPLPVPQLRASFPLNVLIITPRPNGLPQLQMEGDAIKSELEHSGLGSKYHFVRLEPQATYRSLMETLGNAKLRSEPFTILYFDGHGDYGWQCKNCDEINDPDSHECNKCSRVRDAEQKSEGFVYFEDENKNTHAVGASFMATALARSEVQIVALSACDTGKVGGNTIFNAMGPKLIGQFIPVVIAMQFPIKSSDALIFFRAFFVEIGKSNDVNSTTIEEQY